MATISHYTIQATKLRKIIYLCK